MSVIQSLRNLSGTLQIRRADPATQGLKPFSPVDDGSSIDFRRARTRLLNLFSHLEALADLADINTRFKLDLPDARSSAGLGLDLTQTTATLSSVGEINASPMSFSPFGPDWDNGSSALITIGGEYDGSHGSGALSFEVLRDGTHGVDDLRIRVEDPQGSRIRNINIRANHAEDRQYDLRNGLFLTLGPGALIDNDTSTINVFDNVGAAVNPDNPLGGIRNSNPNLQFGTTPVVDGSFSLNGENISVATTDSINDVINRINLSNAGVMAVFNAGSERIDFLQNTAGSVPTIDFQGDTSNFLDATRLSSASVVPGVDRESETSFDSVASFSSVQNGNLLINGTQISIDTATDSLTSVLDAINNSEAGVVASFDTATQKVLIEADDAASALEIDSNGTGFFAALNIDEGRVDAEAVGGGISRRRSYDIADTTAAIFTEINYLFRDGSFLGRGRNTSSFRSHIEAALQATFGGDAGKSILGLTFDTSSNARLRGDLVSVDRSAFTRNLQLRGDQVKNLLAGKNGSGGLIADLLQATRQALTNVNQQLGLSGTFVDTFA